MRIFSVPVLALMLALLFSCWLSNLHFINTAKAGEEESIKSLDASDSPDDESGSALYQYNRLNDPNTGQIPYNIRQKELAFAATLPNNNASRSIDWQHRGPFNI